MHQYWEWCSLFRTLVKSLPFSSLHFSHLVVSNSLQPHGLQHARLPCLSPTPGACSNSCPSSGWCHPIISSSVVPFSSRLQSFLASGSFPRSQFFASGGQTIGASASVLPMNIQHCLYRRCYKRLKHRTCFSQWSKLYHVLLFLNLVSRGAATYLLASVTWGRDEIRQQLEAWLG